MDPNHLDAWPTITEAAAALHTSTRSVLRAQDRGEIEIRKRTRPRKKPENVVNPDDLRKLIEKEAPRPFPVQLPAIAPPPQFHPEASQVDRFIEALRDMNAQRALPPAPAAIAPPAVPLHVKLWLTLEEASAYSGISRAKLREMMNHEALDFSQDGPRGKWIIKRASLESL